LRRFSSIAEFTIEGAYSQPIQIYRIFPELTIVGVGGQSKLKLQLDSPYLSESSITDLDINIGSLFQFSASLLKFGGNSVCTVDSKFFTSTLSYYSLEIFNSLGNLILNSVEQLFFGTENLFK
jgi:hypothetical protein